jgi:hypothetical protein
MSDAWAAREIKIAVREMLALPKVVRIFIEHLRNPKPV